MTLVRTEDLIGPALDWAVMVAAYGAEPDWGVSGGSFGWLATVQAWVGLDGSTEHEVFTPFSPSSDWSQCGPLIDAHDIAVGGGVRHPNGMRLAHSALALAYGPDNLVAACRCIVWGVLGEAVDVPEELV